MQLTSFICNHIRYALNSVIAKSFALAQAQDLSYTVSLCREYGMLLSFEPNAEAEITLTESTKAAFIFASLYDC